MKIYIGCSGFHYKEWKEIFYPAGLPQRKWFDHYSEHFSTLELNVTFYRFPQLGFLENWYAKCPAEFRFAVKVPRLITHYKKFNDTADLLADFYNTVKAGLKDKLGPVLFQLPPSFVFSKERLDAILSAVEPSFENVFEFRHTSWWNSSVRKLLSSMGISVSGISYPGLPDDVIKDKRLAYYRFNGIPHLYHSPYSDEELKRIAAGIKKMKPEKAYIFFNNTAGVAAIKNALTLESMF